MTRNRDLRRQLRRAWTAAAVYSCADGTIKIEPRWAKRFNRPGLLTRLHCAALVEDILRLPRKRIDWKKRAAKANATPKGES